MDLKILEIMKKGTRYIARLEATDKNDTVVVPVELEEGMTKDDIYTKAQEMVPKRIEQIKNPLVVPAIPIPTTPAEIESLRQSLIADINKVVKK